MIAVWINTLIILVCVFSIYGILGQLLLNILNIKKKNYAFMVVVGYMVYQVLFFGVAFPCAIIDGRLSVISQLWLVVIGIIVCLWGYIQRPFGKLRIQINVSSDIYFMAIMAIVILTQCYMASQNASMGSDTAYYTGFVSTSIYTDSIWRYSAYSGYASEVLNIKRVFTTGHVESAVLCYLFKQQPIVYMRYVESSKMVILSNLLYCMLADKLCGKEWKNRCALVMCIALINIVSATEYHPAWFMFFRASEPKALCANFLMPLCLYFCIELITENFQEKKIWLLLAIANFAAAIASGTAMMLTPIVIGIFLGTQLIVKKEWHHIGRLIACLLPSLLMAGCYILAALKFFKIRL